MIDRSKLRFPSSLGLGLEVMLKDLNPSYSLKYLLAQVNVTEEQYRDPDFTYNGEQVLFFLRQIKFLPPDFHPVEAALKYWSWSGTGTAGLAGMSAKNLSQAVSVAVNFSDLFIPGIELKTEVHEKKSYLFIELNTDFEEMNPVVIEIVLCGVKRMGDDMIKAPFPCVMHFEHKSWQGLSDRDAAYKYSEMNNCEVVFNSQFSGLVIENSFLNAAFKHANAVTHINAIQMLNEQKQKSAINQSFAEQVKKTLSDSIKREHFLTLTDIAEIYHLSPRTLIRKLSREGLQFTSLLNDVRLDKAKKLLLASDEPIGDIANKVGYLDVNAFIRAFKRQCGETPNQWRKKHKT